MKPAYKVSAVLTAILSVSAYASWVLWLEHQEKLAAINADVRLKQIENEQAQMLLQAGLRAAPPDMRPPQRDDCAGSGIAND